MGASSQSAFIPPLLSFTAGYVLLSGVFLAHVTGNFVVLGAQIGNMTEVGTLERLAVLPIIVIEVAITWTIKRRFASNPSLILAITEVVFLLIACIAAIVMEQSDNTLRLLRMLLITFGVMAMVFKRCWVALPSCQ